MSPAPEVLSLAQFYGWDETVIEVELHEPDVPAHRLREAVLHHIWQKQSFRTDALVTHDGQTLRTLHPGILNRDGGPDFRDAHLHLDGLDWRGDVELHLCSSDWARHAHHLDPAYDRVVLHVVLEADLATGTLRRSDGSRLPELVLLPYLTAPLRHLLFEYYTRAESPFPCAPSWPDVPATLKQATVRQLGIERLREKKNNLETLYLQRPDLEALLHELVFAALGYAKNAAPMQALARALPLRRIRLLTNPLDLEALHFGVAGLLPSDLDLRSADPASIAYAHELAARFERLQPLFAVEPMSKAAWQFFRLRPANFPTLRIAQACALLAPGGLLNHDPISRLAAALRTQDPALALRQSFDVAMPDFWKAHLRLDRPSNHRSHGIGTARVDDILTNAVLPLLWLHAEQRGDLTGEDRIAEVLETLPAHSDEITRLYGKKPKSALEAQGLHQLYRTRCSQSRCLDCAIGQHLLA